MHVDTEGGYVPEHFLSYTKGIFEHGRREADMGVVYIPSVCPVICLNIIDDEPAVRRHELRLYRREIEANHLRTGI